MLPNFKYHPFPLETGAICVSGRTCQCCGQSRGYVYNGPVYAEAGREEIEKYGPNLIDALRYESGIDNTNWPGYFDAMEADGSPTAYVFRCLHCGKLGGYSDCD
jgi:uncharacterized protein CbrC (UPF0167 family)